MYFLCFLLTDSELYMSFRLHWIPLIFLFPHKDNQCIRNPNHSTSSTHSNSCKDCRHTQQCVLQIIKSLHPETVTLQPTSCILPITLCHQLKRVNTGQQKPFAFPSATRSFKATEPPSTEGWCQCCLVLK